MARLATLKPRVPTADLRKVRPEPKRADPELLTPGHKAWRERVLRRAGYACEKCGRKDGMLFADHVIERRDGGRPFDPFNGQALCGSCHSKKTAAERQKRLAAKP